MTRGTITLKFKKEDIGKVCMVDPSYLTEDMSEYLRYCVKCDKIRIDGKYGSIYNHSMAYEYWLGYELLRHWNDYDKVFNLILGGSCTSLGYGVVDHHIIFNEEDYDEVKPYFSNELPEDEFGYHYLYEDGTWKIKRNGKWVVLSDYIKKHNIKPYIDFVN